MADTAPETTPAATSESAAAGAPVARPEPKRNPLSRPDAPRFTAAELAQYDGLDGRAAYVAYKGFVFDVTESKLWRKGKHLNQHSAGCDLTAEMAAAPHADEVMARFALVGVLVSAVAEAAPALVVREAPPLVAFVLRRHLHPVSVHYPIALGFVASVLTVPALLQHGTALATTLEMVAWWMVLICAAFTPPAAITGLWSWRYNYGGVINPIYRAKITLTLVLCALSIATLLLRILLADAVAGGGTAYWAYSVLVLAHGPLVLALGWFGGKITFPS